MFATTGHAAHSQKKRTLANIYSKSSVAASPQITTTSKKLLYSRFLPLLQSISDSREAVDVHGMNNALTVDFMSAYLFGLKHGTNFTQQVEVRDKILHAYHMIGGYEVYIAEIPWLLDLCNKIGVQLLPKAADEAGQMVEDWNARMCNAAEAYITKPALPRDAFVGDKPVVYQQFKSGVARLRAKDNSAGKELDSPNSLPLANCDLLEVQSEMKDHLLAGHETSAVALTYLYYEMSRHPELQILLREELEQLESRIIWPLPPGTTMDSVTLPEPKQIDSLPLLQAITMETLRLHAPIPGMEPRVSPHAPGGNTLGQYSNIPGGVRVSSMPYSLHRNEDVFPDPLSFKSHRWIPTQQNEEEIKEMHRWFWAFGSGGRMCIGSNFAIQAIKLLVAAVYSNWTTEIIDDEGIQEIDAWTTRPSSNRLLLKYQHV
ncbi:hypothetical protein LTS07_006239 [Exophiala sideris]|uniref:Cytochrome P450 n=1 Tax=Exophiala sideris TaxID=1016849 RepID=A0ABR0J6Q9_9EURO|nr:hypothetical protein LTS07_006239 [Exophiala sideris]KAK5035728.1 hypothetical protein LTR13_005858 [Exophiala sideris]KAK5057363.1 hypothetical protein LTR69_007403 [Exophiala sideris]KAK5181663.1 hypothetical protein LTR44_005862 [Eurotiomycetes sp. CCFEE 6388]